MPNLPQDRKILDRIEALPEGTWQPCPGCAAMLHQQQLRLHQAICPGCGHHFRLGAWDRIASLVDTGTFAERFAELTPSDPLGFVDRMPYSQRLTRAQAATGLTEALIVGTAELAGRPIVIAVLDFGFLGGSMGSVAGEKVVRAADLARERAIPLVAVSTSGGARMQEGVLSLIQMARTSAAIRRLRDAGVPYISVLTDPVYGGVAASFASLGDVIVAETGARAGFAGPRVIKQTIRQELPPGFQTAEFLYSRGHLDLVVRREELQGLLQRLVANLAQPRSSLGRPVPPQPAPPRPVSRERGTDAWETVSRARQLGRPTVLEYIDRIFSGFIELHGDRWSDNDPALVGGLALLDGTPVVVIGHCKGRDTGENIRRNFGMPHPSGYRKAMRLFGLAERLRLPVVTFVDTPGAYPGLAAEEGNQSGAIAETLTQAAGLRVPLVTVVAGEGGSGGALALAVGDRLLMLQTSIFSVISPEGCAAILFGDAARAPEAARALRLRATDIHQLGLADELIPDAPDDVALTAELIGAALSRHLRELAAMPADELVAHRHHRLRALGSTAEVWPGSTHYEWPLEPIELAG